MKRLNFNLALAGVTTLFCVSISFAGHENSGGGYGVGKSLLDFYEAEQRGIEYVDVTKLKGYREIAAPALEKVRTMIPRFYDELVEIRDTKTWMLVGSEIERIDDAMTSLPVEQVGKQNEMEVELFKPWFEHANKLNKGGLIIHELIRGVAMKKGLDQQKTRTLTRLIVLDPSLTDQKLAIRLKALGFGSYTTQSDMCAEAAARAAESARRKQEAYERKAKDCHDYGGHLNDRGKCVRFPEE